MNQPTINKRYRAAVYKDLSENIENLPTYEELKQQRDELLKALKGMMDAYDDVCSEAEPNYKSYEYRMQKWDFAKQAIAKVTIGD